jgi:hypothetical protein
MSYESAGSLRCHTNNRSRVFFMHRLALILPVFVYGFHTQPFIFFSLTDISLCMAIRYAHMCTHILFPTEVIIYHDSLCRQLFPFFPKIFLFHRVVINMYHFLQ